MRSNNIFTRQNFALDNNVLLTLAIIVFFSLGLLGYQTIMHKDQIECAPNTDIYFNGRTKTDDIFYKTGDPIAFKIILPTTEKVVWHFGDNTEDKDATSAIHVFEKTGQFIVSVKINDRCEYFKNINVITPPTDKTDSLGNVMENIIGDSTAYANQSVVFYTKLPATYYEWYLENVKQPAKHGQQASFAFSNQKEYTVVLRLDNDNKKRYFKKIFITKLSEPELNKKDNIQKLIDSSLLKLHAEKKNEEEIVPVRDSVKAPVKKYLVMTDPNLKIYLQSLVCKAIKIDAFNDYLIDGANTKVTCNNVDMNFGDLCKMLQGNKYFITFAAAERDPEKKGITSINLNCERKKIVFGALGYKDPCKD